MKKAIFHLFILIVIISPLLASCSSDGEIDKVGMLVEHSVNDQTWGSKGYQGLLQIKDQFNVDVYFKEGIQTQLDVNRSVDEFVQQGVNLIFGHSSSYGKYFDTIHASYPDVQFVYFNGGYEGENVTSLNFNSNAMGFFAGMVAGTMTQTNEVGIIGAYEWQPEIEGFYEGVKYQNPNANISMNFVNDWDNVERALEIFSVMDEEGVDVFYPAGDSFSLEVVKEVQASSKYAIGFVTDPSDVVGSTVLTSTLQHVDKLYLHAAELFDNNELSGGIFTYDFQDDVISLGEFSPDVPDAYQKKINQEIEAYINTGLLPNERD
ncbi:BMP family ABC transporter substrate-binding protein [Paraliobacillus sediminis]|uniref:BMP family ABC transporter substrate-binding protein n=1 Tax=Paraliobacillus sediminis TaxID=1885916 RepID=UPI001F079AAD|nr:BMP family ABC transporter substrate-binding protein [Paraliobacillus sediminis]